MADPRTPETPFPAALEVHREDGEIVIRTGPRRPVSARKYVARMCDGLDEKLAAEMVRRWNATPAPVTAPVAPSPLTERLAEALRKAVAAIRAMDDEDVSRPLSAKCTFGLLRAINDATPLLAEYDATRAAPPVTEARPAGPHLCLSPGNCPHWPTEAREPAPTSATQGATKYGVGFANADRAPLPDEPCHRAACRRPGATWWNCSTRAYYCAACAKAINHHNQGLCVEWSPCLPPATAPTPPGVRVLRWLRRGASRWHDAPPMVHQLGRPATAPRIRHPPPVDAGVHGAAPRAVGLLHRRRRGGWGGDELTPSTHTEHRPGLRTDRCRLCARNQRRGLTLCHGCPESARRVHLVVHVCPPGEQGTAGQMGLFGGGASTERTSP